MKSSRKFGLLGCAGFAFVLQACSYDFTLNAPEPAGSGGGPAEGSSSSGGDVGSSSTASAGGEASAGVSGGGGSGVGMADLRVGYSFDEVGTEIADFSGNGHTGTLGAFSWIPGVASNAIRLDGRRGHVRLPPGITDGLNDFSVSTWVNPTRFNTWMRIFDFGAGSERYVMLSTGEAGKPRFASKNGGGEQTVDSSVALRLDTWQHIAVTQSGNTVSLYIDGALVGSNNAVTVRASSFSADQSWLGRSQYDYDPYFEGAQDEFKLYRRALTVSEVRTLASRGVSPAGLFIGYSFDETTGFTAADSSGNSKHGQSDGGVSWGAGRIGDAIQLDGDAGYVRLPDDILRGIGDFSIAVWVKQAELRDWARIADFGNSTSSYWTLVANAGASQKLRFNLKVDGAPEEIVDGAALPVGSWQHVAITRAGSFLSIYLNGVLVGAGTVIGVLPDDGATKNNWLGRSQYQDRLLEGALDDFRLYTRALSAAEIGSVMREAGGG